MQNAHGSMLRACHDFRLLVDMEHCLDGQVVVPARGIFVGALLDFCDTAALVVDLLLGKSGEMSLRPFRAVADK